MKSPSVPVPIFSKYAHRWNRPAPIFTTCLRCRLTAYVFGVASIRGGAVTRTFIFFKLRFFIVLRLL